MFNLCKEGSQHLVIREANNAEDQWRTGLETLKMTIKLENHEADRGKGKLCCLCLVENPEELLQEQTF